MDKKRKNVRKAELPILAAKPKSGAAKQAMVRRILKIGRECAALPVLDKRKPDDMLYDKHGLPK